MLPGEKNDLAMVLVSFCCLAQKTAIYLEAVCSKFHATRSKRNRAMVAVAFHEIKNSTINLVAACSNGHGSDGLLSYHENNKYNQLAVTTHCFRVQKR